VTGRLHSRCRKERNKAQVVLASWDSLSFGLLEGLRALALARRSAKNKKALNRIFADQVKPKLLALVSKVSIPSVPKWHTTLPALFFLAMQPALLWQAVVIFNSCMRITCPFHCVHAHMHRLHALQLPCMIGIVQLLLLKAISGHFVGNVELFDVPTCLHHLKNDGINWAPQDAKNEKKFRDILTQVSSKRADRFNTLWTDPSANPQVPTPPSLSSAVI
jgi:hypothetical protein